MRRLALLAVLSFLAGCAADPAPDTPIDSVAPPIDIPAHLANLTAPVFDKVAAVDRWEDFVEAYSKRDWRLPHNKQAADFLAAELDRAGYKSEVLTVPTSFGAGPAQVPTQMYIVRGVLEGANASHRFALVAHYDTITTTGQGAYDDGAGTMAELEICKTLAQRRAELNHTIECIFFDAEEGGLRASKAFVDAYVKDTGRSYTYDLVFGYDMTGINWPGHEWNLFAMIGTQHDNLTFLLEPFHGFLDQVYTGFLDKGPMPGAAEGIAVLDLHDRNSDEQMFKRAGIPVVRFAGGRHAADYPMYHQPGDTIPYVYQFVGGRANFEKGFEAVVLSSYYTILAFDVVDPPNMA